MRGEFLRRGAAVGVAIGAAAVAVTVGGTPALRAEPAAAFALGAVVVCVYAGIGLALGALLTAGSAAGGPLRACAERIGSARALWPLAALAIAFAAWNEAVRVSDALAVWRHAGRAAIAAAAAIALAAAFVRPRPARPATRRLERFFTAGIAPALLGLALYAARPAPAPASDPAELDVLAYAPRFAPEPREAFAPTAASDRPRVLLIGVDGASWDRVERGIERGALPTFARLRDRGVAAPLVSEQPTYSPRLWTTIATGVAPSAHGIEDFYLMQLPRLGVENLALPRSLGVVRSALEASGELRFVPVTSSLRRAKAIWNLADEAGLASAVIGLWATWPPEALAHGVVVSDHASVARRREWLDRGKASAESQVTTWPPALAAELAPLQRAPDSVTREELGRFVAVDDATWRAFEATRHFSKEERISAFRSSHLNDAFFAAAAERVWRERRPDLLVLYLRAVDELSHFYYEAGVPEAAALGWSAADVARFGGVVDRAYEATDRAIAPLVDDALASGDTLVVLVSDHGWEREPDGRYNHNRAPAGILMLAGAGVCRAACPPLAEATLYDVAPTVLARLGLPLSDEMRGRPLDAAFQASRAPSRVARYGEPLSRGRAVGSSSDAALREKLEALGYLRR
jgi:hypothetical protein